MIVPMNADPLPTNHTPADTPLTPEHARLRASVVMFTMGLAQLLPLIMALLPLNTNFDLRERRDWLIAIAMGGGVYVLTALPVRLNMRLGAWLAIAAASAQAVVFILLALLSIIAAFKAGSPGSMTMGVLLFGTVASMHLFIARWIWPGLRSAAP